MKTTMLFSLRRVLGAVVCWAALITRGGVPLDPDLARMPVDERITQAPVFVHPILYASDRAPDPAESEALWMSIDVLRQNGPELGVPALLKSAFL